MPCFRWQDRHDPGHGWFAEPIRDRASWQSFMDLEIWKLSRKAQVPWNTMKFHLLNLLVNIEKREVFIPETFKDTTLWNIEVKINIRCVSHSMADENQTFIYRKFQNCQCFADISQWMICEASTSAADPGEWGSADISWWLYSPVEHREKERFLVCFCILAKDL